MSGLFGLNYKIAEANSTKPIEEKCDWIKKNLGDGFAKGTYGNPYFNGYNNQDEFSYGMKYNENIYSVRKNCTNMPSVNY